MRVSNVPAHILLVTAWDPGLTTGWATWNVSTNEFDSDQGDYSDAYAKCHSICGAGSGVMWIAERFIITVNTAKNTQAPWSLEMIGVLRYFASVYSNSELHMQAQAEGKLLGTDDRLKLLGWHKRGKVHANDAARHLLSGMARRGWLDVETMMELALT